jgi:hypothetical protein
VNTSGQKKADKSAANSPSEGKKNKDKIPAKKKGDTNGVKNTPKNKEGQTNGAAAAATPPGTFFFFLNISLLRNINYNLRKA